MIGREWQLGTVQVDYNLPERFDLSYVGRTTKIIARYDPPSSVWINGTICGCLIEHFGGNFPTWLAPEQVRLLPMNDDLIPYAESCLEKLKAKGVRASIDGQSAKLGAKIRKAETDKIPHMLILGKREAEEGKVSLRSRSNPDFDGPLMMDEIVTLITSEISSKSLPKTRTSTN